MATDRVERRLVAILAADVVGYSRLIGVDEEGTLARLKALRRELIAPTLAEHHGMLGCQPDKHATMGEPLRNGWVVVIENARVRVRQLPVGSG